MRYKRKDPAPIIEIGTRNTITEFLWFPLYINREWRWLEYATYIEEVVGGWERPNYWWYKEWMNT